MVSKYLRVGEKSKRSLREKCEALSLEKVKTTSYFSLIKEIEWKRKNYLFTL